MSGKLLVLITLFTISLPLSLWSKSPSVVIFPYFQADNSGDKTFSFLQYTVPDSIHQELLNENKLYVFEKDQLVTDADKIIEGEQRLEICRSLESNYFIWGYYLIEGEKLIIFNHLVETLSGRTLKIEKKEFSTGPEIFDQIEIFTRSFSLWINRELPEREIFKETIIQKETIYVEKKSPVSIGISTGLFYSIILPEYFSGALNNGIGGVLDFNVYPSKTEPFYFGFSIPVTMLKTKDTDIMEIDVLVAPILLKAGLDLRLSDFMHLKLSADFGGSFLFGYKDTEILSYFRPALGLDIHLEFTPKERFHISPGVRYLYVYNTYQGNSIHLIQPQLAVSFSF